MQEKKEKKCTRRIISGKIDEAPELKLLVGDVIEEKITEDTHPKKPKRVHTFLQKMYN